MSFAGQCVCSATAQAVIRRNQRQRHRTHTPRRGSTRCWSAAAVVICRATAFLRSPRQLRLPSDRSTPSGCTHGWLRPAARAAGGRLPCGYGRPKGPLYRARKGKSESDRDCTAIKTRPFRVVHCCYTLTFPPPPLMVREMRIERAPNERPEIPGKSIGCPMKRVPRTCRYQDGFATAGSHIRGE